MRPSFALRSRLPIRRTTSRQSWDAFVESVTSRDPDDPSIFRSDRTVLREEAPTTTNQSAANYRRFKPTTRFSIYKMTEIQRTVEEGLDYKLVFYAPVDSVGRIKDAIFEVGGGVLGGGKYSRCCFQSYGTGQFRAEVGANSGELGVTKVQEEVKVEITCHGKKVTRAAVRALLHTHPLDVPVYEVYKTEFGFLPHQLISQHTTDQRRSWRPHTEEEQKLESTIQNKIAIQFEGARLAAKHAAESQTAESGENRSVSWQHTESNESSNVRDREQKSFDERLNVLRDFLDKETKKREDSESAPSS
ncbi:hypothetical protein TWF730_004312 [Orbilia blumenaviensis]|uniref:ATP phosphoribosyltransferase n=1 Tax=Orbilia blumenaviensis TaxID=1796055 RepID=A0AAV9U084_9PEZI